MAIALDSDVVDALVFYVTDNEGVASYVSGDARKSIISGISENSTDFVAIQYKAEQELKTIDESLSDLPDISESEPNTEPSRDIEKRDAPSVLDYLEAVKEKEWTYAALLDRYIVNYDESTYIVLTIRPKLQKKLEDVYRNNSVRLGAGIIKDPRSGEILAMTSSRRNQVLPITSEEFKSNNWALRSTFPIASIMKIIATAAGIDSGSMTANSRFRAWQQSQMTVWRAFATSHNGVFGHMARKMGRETLLEYMDRFNMNRNFFFDLPVGKSIADLPVNPTQMGQAAAGLNRDFLVSPIHVASIISTVLNRGATMKPYLMDYVVRDGRVIFRREPFRLGQPISVETARDIYKMYYATTAVGTGRRGFGGFADCPDLAKMCGGKTGTLTGNSPNYLYTWFGGFTKVTGRTLCIVTLSGQQNHSGIKAASLAGQLSYNLWKSHNPDRKPVITSR